MSDFATAIDRWASLSGTGTYKTVTGEFLNVMKQVAGLADSAQKLLGLL